MHASARGSVRGSALMGRNDTPVEKEPRRIQLLPDHTATSTIEAAARRSRVCQEAGCRIRLSQYNNGRTCFAHQSQRRDGSVFAPTTATGAQVESSPTRHSHNERSTTRTSSMRIADEALAILEDLGEWMTSNSTLCAMVGVSERSLQKAFNDTFGAPPSVYLRRRALRAARDVLEQTSRDETSVSEVAVNHGFAHLGRFAQYYKELFEESPSATLRREPALLRLAS